MSDELPRGIQNNNPLNIRSGQMWQGLAIPQTDPAFCQFISMAYGIRAAAKILLNYYKVHKITTLGRIVVNGIQREGIISRWAPESENDTRAYEADVCQRTGFKLDQPLDLTSRRHMRPLLEAMIWHENGQNPISDKDMDFGLTMAGI